MSRVRVVSDEELIEDLETRIDALEAENKALREDNVALRLSLHRACREFLDLRESEAGREIKSGELPSWWHRARALLAKEAGE